MTEEEKVYRLSELTRAKNRAVVEHHRTSRAAVGTWHVLKQATTDLENFIETHTQTISGEMPLRKFTSRRRWHLQPT